jgi:hypothetical protein
MKFIKNDMVNENLLNYGLQYCLPFEFDKNEINK